MPVVCLVVLVGAAAVGAYLTFNLFATKAPAPKDPNAAASALLVRSAAAQRKAAAFNATFSEDIGFSSNPVRLDGSLAFRAPDSGHMEFKLEGRQTEASVTNAAVYVRSIGDVWRVVSGELSGGSQAVYSQYVANRGAVDFGAISSNLLDVRVMDDEEIDGVMYHHVRGSVDITDMESKLPKDIFDPALARVAKNEFPVKEIEAWIDRATSLPRRLTLSVAFDVDTERTPFTITTDYRDWDQPVDIPLPPADAAPFVSIGRTAFPGAPYPVAVAQQMQIFADAMQVLGDIGPNSYRPDPESRLKMHRSLQSVRDARSAVEALTPPDKFRASWDKFVYGLGQLEERLVEIDREIDQGGAGSARAVAVGYQALVFVKEGNKLFDDELGKGVGCANHASVSVVETPFGRLYHDGGRVPLTVTYNTPGCRKVGGILYGTHGVGSPWFTYWCISHAGSAPCAPDHLSGVLNFADQDIAASGTVTLDVVPGTFPPANLSSRPTVEGFTPCFARIIFTDGIIGGTYHEYDVGTRC